MTGPTIERADATDGSAVFTVSDPRTGGGPLGTFDTEAEARAFLVELQEREAERRQREDEGSEEFDARARELRLRSGPASTPRRTDAPGRFRIVRTTRGSGDGEQFTVVDPEANDRPLGTFDTVEDAERFAADVSERTEDRRVREAAAEPS